MSNINVLNPHQPILVSGVQVVPAGIPSSYRSGTGKVCLHFHDIYDFSQNGGAVSTITLNAWLPANAVLTFGFVDLVTAVTGTSGGTIAVGFTGTLVGGGTNTTCLLGATAIASFTPAELFLALIPTPATAATWIKTATAGQISVTIAVHALTAGKFEIYGDYYVATNA